MQPFDDVMTTTVVAVVLVAVVLAACIIPALLYVGYRQRTGIMAYAEAQGWTYRDHDAALAKRYLGHPFVGDADARAEAVISGSFWGMPFAAYAYTHQSLSIDDSGRQTTVTHSVPVVSLLLDSALPDLDVVPAGVIDGVWSSHAVLDAIAASADFSDTFTVRTSDHAFAARVLSARLTHDLMAYPDRGWSVRAGDVLSIASWNGKPEKIPSYLDLLAMIVNSIPEPVWQTYGGRPTTLGRSPDQG